jgi:glycosyltransferase involved in cell wall biosynthesis
VERRFFVTHFACTMDPKMGGIPSGILNVCSTLMSYGVDGRVISTGNTNANLKAAKIQIQQLKNLGISVTTFTSPIENSYGLSTSFFLHKKIEKAPDEDLLVLHQIYTLSTLYGYLYARRHGIPYAIFPHGSLTNYHSKDSRFRKLVARRLYINKILNKSSLIIVTCESEFQDLADSLKNKSRIIPYSILTTHPKSVAPAETSQNLDGPNIIFSGRFHRKKNISLILEALPSVIRVFPKVKLKLAGDGSPAERQILEKEIEKLAIANNVEFVGWLEGDELTNFYSSGDLLVMPSFNENFALVVTEALQAGTPCVVSKNVGTADIIQRRGAGLVLSDLTHESLAEALVEVLANGKRHYQNAIAQVLSEELKSERIANIWLEAIIDLKEEHL